MTLMNLPIGFSDIGSIFFEPVKHGLIDLLPQGIERLGPSGLAYDIAILLIWRYRVREVKPLWLDICHLTSAWMADTRKTSYASFCLRRVGCKGVTVDISGAGGTGIMGLDDEMCLGMVDGDGLKNTHMIRQSVADILKNSGITKALVALVLIDLTPPGCLRKEISQNELEDQRRLINGILVSLSLLNVGGDIIVGLNSSLLTRFSGSLIQLLSTIFKDVAIWRPPTSSAWTQRRYLYFRYRQDDQKRVEIVRSVLKRCSQAVEAGKISIHYVLPPVLFAENAFTSWLTKVNDTLGIEEYVNLHEISTNTARILGQKTQQARKISLKTAEVLYGRAALTEGDVSDVSWPAYWKSYVKLLLFRYKDAQDEIQKLFRLTGKQASSVNFFRFIGDELCISRYKGMA